jgi:hypothetical protein
MIRRAARHRLPRMSPTQRDRHLPGLRDVATSPVVWNTVMPALGLALILGASLLPALVAAAVAAVAIAAVLGDEPRVQPRR